MTEPDSQPPEAPIPLAPRPNILAELFAQLRPLLVGLPLLTLLTGVVFPLVLAALAWPLFPAQSGGSLLKRDGVVVGSELIGQNFKGSGYFQPRPSAAGDGYDGMASNGSNLGPANPKLRKSVQELAEAYRRMNGLAPDTVIPIDAVTASGSGLDPHISPANAALQVTRVAAARSLETEAVRRLVSEHTLGRPLGILGEPRVNVLTLNLALDQAAPLPSDR